MVAEVKLQLIDDSADPQWAETLVGYLRRELLQLDLEAVGRLPAGVPPPGARGVGASALGLLVSLGPAADGLRALVQAVQYWLARGRDPGRGVRIEIDGDVLVLANAPPADQARLVELFIDRHT